MHVYIQTKVHYILSTNDVKATEFFYVSILKPWNGMAIKRMFIQCVPGALFPSLLHLGPRLRLEVPEQALGEIHLYRLWGCSLNIHMQELL